MPGTAWPCETAEWFEMTTARHNTDGAFAAIFERKKVTTPEKLTTQKVRPEKVTSEKQ